MFMDFEGQRADEKVEFVFRRSLATSWRGVAFCLAVSILGFLPILLWPDNQAMVFIWIFFVIMGLLGVLYTYLLWYYSLYIVTDERLRQIKQKGIFTKTVVDLDLSKIENMSFGTKGLGSGLYGYGTLLIQTAAGDLVISKVSHPEAVYNRLQNVLHKIRR